MIDSPGVCLSIWQTSASCSVDASVHDSLRRVCSLHDSHGDRACTAGYGQRTRERLHQLPRLCVVQVGVHVVACGQQHLAICSSMPGELGGVCGWGVPGRRRWHSGMIVEG
jgi:hypothetical protein